MITSGAIQYGEPAKVCRFAMEWVSCTDSPKSASLSFVFSRNSRQDFVAAVATEGANLEVGGGAGGYSVRVARCHQALDHDVP